MNTIRNVTANARALTIAMFFSIAVIPSQTRAGVILQNQSFWGMSQIQDNSPIGQTFTAEDAKIASIAFSIEDVNSYLPNGTTTMKLFQGVGMGGPLLATSTVVIPPGTSGFFDFDFSSVTLSVGGIYTAIIERPNERWGVMGNQHSYYGGGGLIPGRIDYTGGDVIFLGAVGNWGDLRFKVTPMRATAIRSTLTASPSSAPADGNTAITAIVTLKDQFNNPVPGKIVTLYAGTAPVIIAPTFPPLITDVNGQITATITATTPCDATITALVQPDWVPVSQTATVHFHTSVAHANRFHTK